jgi:2-methylcitrate dehydratase
MRQTRVGELSMWKGAAFANASRNGVFAARLAAAGMTGPAPIFEGSMGFMKQVSGPFELDVESFGGQGRPFMIDRTYIKYWPAEYHSQSAIDAALTLRPDVGAVEEIADILIESFDAAVDIMGGEPEKWRPQSRETADHSLPYCVAVALVDGKVWLDQFDEARFRDEELLSLVAKIRVERNDDLSARYPEGIPNRITITTQSGARYTHEVTYPRGHAGNPMTDAEVEEKFHALADPVLPEARIAEALKRLWHLDEEQEIGEVLKLFAVE